MEDHVPTIDLISRINNVQVSSNYPISAFVNFFSIHIYFQPGFIGKRRRATPCRLGRTKRGSTTGGKGIKQECNSFLRQSLFILSMEMAKRFGGAKQKCLQRIRSQVPHYCWISWTYKAIFAGPIFTWGNQRNRQKKRRE